jgi:gliding motility-associated-like protein
MYDMNKTLFRTLKTAGTLLASFFVASLSAQTVSGPVNFTDGTTTDICATGINFYDDAGPTAPYGAAAAPGSVEFHTVRFLDGNNYGNTILITANNIQIDVAVGEEDTLAIYANTAGIATIADVILGSPNLRGFATNAGLFNPAGATVPTINVGVNNSAVFAFKQTGASNAGSQGWDLNVDVAMSNFQEFESEVRFTNGGNQPNKISNNNAYVLCPDTDYDFVFNVSNFNFNGDYSRAIDIDSIVIDFRDGSPLEIVNNPTHTGTPAPGSAYVAEANFVKQYNVPGAYEIVYDVYDKNCGQKQFTQRLIVLDDPNYSYSSSFGVPPYTICQGDVLNIRVASNGSTLPGPDFSEGTTIKSVRWLNSGESGLQTENYTLSADLRTMTFDGNNAPGTYQLVAESFFDQNDQCAFYDTIEVTVLQPVYAGTESVLAPGFDPEIPFVCETETSFDLFTLLEDTSATLDIDPNGTWTDASGNVITNVIDPSTLGGAGGYSFTYTVPGNGICPDDFEVVRLDVEAQPYAGYAMTVAERKDECSSINNLDLFGTDYIGKNGPADLGGTWVCTNVPGAASAITLNRFLDLTALPMAGGSSRDFDFQYTVSGRASTNPKDLPCGDAFGMARIRVALSPIAGEDSTLYICNTEGPINLNTLLRNENYQGTGQWEGDAAVLGQTNVFIPSVTFDPRNITAAGTYVMSYKLDQPNTGVPPCASDQINITFEAILEPDAGDDGTTESCDTETAFDLFSGLDRIGNSTNGTWFDDATGTALAGSTADLSAAGGTTVTYTYVVDGNKDLTPGRGCDDEMATVTINVQEALLVGGDRTLAACITDAPFSPYDTLVDPKQPDGNWSPAIQGDNAFDATFDPSAAALNTLFEYKYSHPANTPGCALLESTVSITVYDLPMAGADNEQLVDICNVDNTFDLQTLIEAGVDNGVNGTTMLTWVFESTDGSAPVDPMTGLVDITNLGDRFGIDYDFRYIVQSPGCTDDTAFFRIKVFKQGNAGNDNSFVTCTSWDEDILLFDFVNTAGTTDDWGTWTDATPTGAITGNDNLATFNPNDVGAVTAFPSDMADSLFYVVVVENCPDDTAKIATYHSKEPLAGISNTPIGVDGPLAACENEEDLDLFTGLTDTYDDGGTWELEIWPPNRNADPAFLALRTNVNSNIAEPVSGDLYFKPEGNIFNLARFDSNYVNSHNGDPKELFQSPIFRFRYIVKDTTNFPVGANNFGYRCPEDTSYVYVRVEADFTNTDNFNFELETDPTIAGSKNPPLDITKVVVCETETDFLLNDYFPGLTDIVNCVNAPQDDFVINTLPAGALYSVSGSTDYFVDATVIAPSETDFEVITLSVTNECGTAITQAPLELRIEPFADDIPIDPITLCGSGTTIDLSLEEYIGQYYADNFADFQTKFNPTSGATAILVTAVNVDPSNADFSNGSPKLYKINLEIDRMHCPDLVNPINFTINQEPYVGDDQLGVKVCGDGILNLNNIVISSSTSPATGQTLDVNGVFTCPSCVPAYSPQPYNSATVDKALYAGTIQDFYYQVTLPGCGRDSSRVQIIFEEKKFAGETQEVTICNNESNVFLPALLAASNGTQPDGGGKFTPDPFKGKNGNFFDATQHGPTTIEFTYTVGGKTGDVCPASTAVLRINIEDAPTAGTDGEVDVCMGDGPVDLFNGINGQADNIGQFEPVNPIVDPSYLSGPNSRFFDFTSYVNASGGPKPTIALFYYVVETGSCPADTSVITVNISPAPKAGVADTIPTTLCKDLTSFDLFTVLGNVETGNGDGDYSAGGVWSVLTPENGSLTGSIIDPSTLSNTRVHHFKYTVSTDCGDAFSIVAVTMDVVPSVGDNVNDSLCSDGAVINLSVFYPQFSGGEWRNVGDDVGALSGNLFATSKIVGNTVDLEYVVNSKLGECNDGVATVSLRVFDISNAGDDEELSFVLCKEGSDVDLYDVLQGETAGGTFEASAGIANNNALVGSSIIVSQIPLGSHKVLYIAKAGPCPGDTAIINISVADLSSESPYCGDFDGDGVANVLDLDIDNDGISNLDESGGLDLMGDHDKDLLANFLDRDYADAISSDFRNGVVSAFDMDNDGLVNMFDLDSDGDVIFDIVEAFPDSYTIYDAPTSADGKTDTQNAEGINDVSKNDKVVDTDTDGFEDFLDLDSDSDGILDNTENIGQAYNVINTDGDVPVVANYRDEDSDNDGIYDIYENNNGTATDPANSDNQNDGPDYVDLDSDNDGIPDADEAFLASVGGEPEDWDIDTFYNFQDVDSDNDLIADKFEGLTNTNTDPGSNQDFRNLDSDGDGIPDRIEGLCSVVGDEPNNADDNGAYDFQELDSDKDLLSDSLEAGIDPTMPINSDGGRTYDFQQTDADGDGLLDTYEAGPNVTYESGTGYILDPVDTDADSPYQNGDGLFDFQDHDSDNDLIPDSVEGFDLVRFPGVAGVDTDSDLSENLPDYLDLDSDNDGIPDAIEAGADGSRPDDSNDNGIADFREIDSDGDGVLDRIEGTEDCDNDGTPNYKDAGDNCKITTFIPEGFSPNGDNVNDVFIVPDLNTFPGRDLKVYNRWGGLVYENEKYDNTWDGKDENGNRLVDGTYFYTLDLGLGQEPQTGYVYIVGKE